MKLNNRKRRNQARLARLQGYLCLVAGLRDARRYAMNGESAPSHENDKHLTAPSPAGPEVRNQRSLALG